MGNQKKNLCIFIHFSHLENFPYYVVIYLNELSMYFDEIILVANNRHINNKKALNHRKIRTLFVKNEGYDLGMFYKAFQTIDPNDYYQIACINDSNILFNKLTTIFNWGKASKLDVWGLIDSIEKPILSTHEDNYHIQSHFMVFNEKAIQLLPAYFNSIDIQGLYQETDVETLRNRVIDQWEIGVSQYMIKNGLKIGSYINGLIYSSLYIPGKIRNISRRLYPQLVEAGYPLIKKKVIMDSRRKHFFKFRPSWKKLVRQYGNKGWGIENLVNELTELRNQQRGLPFYKLMKRFQGAQELTPDQQEKTIA